MRLIISPAKKMREDTDSFPYHSLPRFLPQTREILAALRAMSPAELQALWKCSDRITAQNVARYLKQFEREMRDAARDLEFEKAAALRDRIKQLREQFLIA